HRVEREEAIAVPAEVVAEVLLGAGGAAERADEAALAGGEEPGLEGDRSLWDADRDGGTPSVDAEEAGAHGAEALVEDGLQADGVEGVVEPAAGEVADGLDGVGLAGVDEVGRAEGAGELQLLRGEVHRDDLPGARDLRPREDVHAHAAHPEDGHRL